MNGGQVNKNFSVFIILALVMGCGSQTDREPSALKGQDATAGLRIGAQGTRIADHGTDWFNESANGTGAMVDQAYENYPFQKEQGPIVVAVIDSGVDIEHEDLQGRIWVNTHEIPGDGVDNDNNGYIDDIHGWNYLVDKDGRDIGGETLELTREFARYYQPYLDWRHGTGPKLSSADYNRLVELYNEFAPKYRAARSGSDQALYHYNWQLEQRGDDLTDFTHIKGDTPNLEDKRYGNASVIGPDARHGTHVAGIIAAVRDNGIGIDGIATHVRIMVLRAVPNGDEHDKDIANAVRYAADNGARIVNMSFGKSLSRFPEKVIEAMEYAAEKGVLFVHAAGNSSQNNDDTPSFPNRRLASTHLRSSWIEVGASTDLGGLRLPATFSNYGSTTVDLFAPGYKLLSTVPGNNYLPLSGTSMAAPVVAGVAALVLSHTPELRATELKSLIMDTARKYPNQKVYRPGSQAEVSFSSLSRTAGIVDAERALEQIHLR